MFRCRRFTVAAIGLLAWSTAIGCASSPRQRPVGVGDVDTGPESLTAVRQRLDGTWALATLAIFDETGKKVDVEATGTLVSDAYGGLAIEYRMSDAGQKALGSLGIVSPNPVMTTSGRVAIDPRQHQITYVGADYTKQSGYDAGLAAKRANPFALERIRYYTFNADGSLSLATRHDNGREAVVSTWKRGS